MRGAVSFRTNSAFTKFEPKTKVVPKGGTGAKKDPGGLLALKMFDKHFCDFILYYTHVLVKTNVLFSFYEIGLKCG